MELSNQSSGMITPGALRELALWRSEQGPVFSLYLDARAGDAVPRFEDLEAGLRAQKKMDTLPQEEQRLWDQAALRAREALRRGDFRGPGLAVIAADGLLRVFDLPAALPDRLVVGPAPFVRPIEVQLAEFGCTLVALVDEQSARLVRVFGGRAEEIENAESVPVTGAAGDEDAALDSARERLRELVEMVQSAWEAQPCARIVTGGSRELARALRGDLAGLLEENLVSGVEVAGGAALDEIVALARTIEADEEKRLEAQRVQELISAARSQGGAALGLEQTLLVVRSKKARMLVVAEDFHLQGGVCPNCGYIGEWEGGLCLLCETALRPDPDIIEALAARVVEQGGQLEVLRSEPWRRALEEFGNIGALLSASGAPEMVDQANRRPIVMDGRIDRDALHDEAIEESFPASDAPSF